MSRRRDLDLQRRIAAPEGALARCTVLDCGQPTTARAGHGLNRHYCQRHVEHYRRHGSYSKGSYSAAELNPRRRSALAWLEAHRDTPAIRDAVERVRALYARAGRPEEAFRLAGKSPEERARNVWARLRHFDVDPLQILATWVAVQLCHRDDARPERKMEFRWVQAAKCLHRLAGGSHKRWEREREDGRPHMTELHKYPASRGRVLRHLGQALDDAASSLKEFLEAIDCAQTSNQMRK